jgi:outer membrane protein TolC
MIRYLFCFCFSLSGLLGHAEELEPLNLSQLQSIAYEFSPDLARQRLSFSNIVESVTIARTKYDPSFTVRRSWEENNDPERTTGSISQTLPADLDLRFTARNQLQGGEEVTDFSVNLSKTILGGGTFLESRLPLEQAWMNQAQEANRLSLQVRELRLTVARRYYAVVRNLLTLRLRQLQLERARRNLEHAIAKEDPLDIATAELRIPESELDVNTTERLIRSSTLDLAETIGLPVTQPLNVSTNLVYEVRPFSKEQDMLYALEHHETILNARLQLELDEMEAKVARTQNWPELRVEATYSEEDGRNETTSNTRGDVVLEWDWLDRTDRAQRRQRINDVERSKLALFEAEQTVTKTIENTAAQLQESELAVELRRERVKVLERQLILYQDRWENGEINILEYVRSQNDFENAKVQLVTQQASYMELRAEYDFLIGK